VIPSPKSDVHPRGLFRGLFAVCRGLSRQSRNVPLGSKVRTSPFGAVPKPPIPSCQESLVSACGGFRQGRAPLLRAPEGSLDGFRQAAQWGQEGMGATPLKLKGTFLLCQKGTFSLCCHSENRGLLTFLLKNSRLVVCSAGCLWTGRSRKTISGRSPRLVPSTQNVPHACQSPNTGGGSDRTVPRRRPEPGHSGAKEK
jgi:hypothetical protein